MVISSSFITNADETSRDNISTIVDGKECRCADSQGMHEYSNKSLGQHLSVRKDNIEVGYENECPHCDYTSSFKLTFQRHLRIVHYKDFPYVCHVCGRGFRSKGLFGNHELTHTGVEKPYKCDKKSPAN